MMNSDIIEISSDSSPASPSPMDFAFGHFLLRNEENFNFNTLPIDELLLNFSPVASPIRIGELEEVIFNDLLEAEVHQEIPVIDLVQSDVGSDDEEGEELEEDSGYKSNYIPTTSAIESDDSSDSVSEYDPNENPQREAKLRRILGLRLYYWRAKSKILRLRRERNLRNIQDQLDVLARQREHYIATTPTAERPSLKREIERDTDRPHRGVDRCFGCAKIFWLQKIRRWDRCENCNSWLCPDCNEEPEHCQNDGGLL